jgi:hypothetical protein
MSERLKRLIIMAAALAACLTGCAPHLSQEALNRQTPIPTKSRIEAVCDPRVANPYMISECRDRRIAAGEKVGPLDPAIQQAIIKDQKREQMHVDMSPENSSRFG